MRFIEEPSSRIPVVAEAEVVVAGGGPGGLIAAVAAARAGVKTFLIERYGFLGGMATAGLIGPILGHRAHEAPIAILGGLPRELCERLHSLRGAPSFDECLNQWGVPFDSEVLKIVADEMVQDAKVELMLHTWVSKPIVEDGRISALIVESKSGRGAVQGRVFIDATGDADVAFRAGLPTSQGRRADGRVQSMGSMFRISGVRQLSSEERKIATERVHKAKESGELYVYNAGLGHHGSTLQPHQLTPNMTRFAGDPTNVFDLTQGELFIRRQTMKVVEFYRRNVPGFENCYLEMLPTQIGVRESRQIVGMRTLTGKDVVQAIKPEDSIALGSWWIDIHCPLGRVLNDTHLCRRDCPTREPCIMLEKFPEDLPETLYLPKREWYGIPYGCLVPQGVSNLLVAGRCISADHIAMSSARVMGTCMAIGEAAGTAAALAFQNGVPPADIEVGFLQDRLKANGALI